MITLLIIFGILFLIALLRFGVAVKYSETGLQTWVTIGFISLLIYPEKEHRIKKIKKIRKKRKEIMKPGSLDELLKIIKPIKNSLSRLKRRLLIKRLKITYIAGGKDPSQTAMSFGTANAVFSIIIPMLEDNFRIGKRDINIQADFISEEQKIYLDIAISIAVWEVVYIMIALLPILFIKKTDKNVSASRVIGKEAKENG
jgi:hypothetical protein